MMCSAGGLLVVMVTCAVVAAYILVWLLFFAARRLRAYSGNRKWLSPSSSESERIYQADRASMSESGNGWLAGLFQTRPKNSKASIPFHVPNTATAAPFDSCSIRRQQQQQQFDQSPLGGADDTGNVNLGLTFADSMTSSEVAMSPAHARRRSVEMSPSNGVRMNHRGSIVSCIGGIDPNLYKMAPEIDGCNGDEDGGVCHVFPEGHIGRARLGIHYERDTERLMVHLMNIRNLPSRHPGTANACDPFVRICLLPDTRSHMQSKFRKRTCNPKFDDNFIFPVSMKNMVDRVIKLTVIDVDRVRRHNVIGYALLPLKDRKLDERQQLVSLDLQPSDANDGMAVGGASEEKQGELNLALTYNDHVQRLLVGIIEGRNIKAGTDSGSADFYVKASLMRQNVVIKTKKTEVIKRDSDPKFNESLAFKLPSDALDSLSVVIAVWQSLTGQKDKCVGRFVVGSFMFARGKELEHWDAMVAAPRQQICQWHVIG